MRLSVVLLACCCCFIAACARQPATDAARRAPPSRDSLVAASFGLGLPDGLGGPGRSGAPGTPGAPGSPGAPRSPGAPGSPDGFGGVRGEIVPAGVEAVIQVTAAGADTHVIGPTFSDPLSGAFTAEELPVGVYEVVVVPIDPAYKPRVFAGVVVPHDGLCDLGTVDLGTVDLGRDPADTLSGKGSRGQGEAR